MKITITTTTHSEYFGSGDGAIIRRGEEAELREAERRQTGWHLVGRRERTEIVEQEDSVDNPSYEHRHRISRCKQGRI